MHRFAAMEENLRATLAVFARAHRDGETRDLPDISLASSGLQFSMFNTAVLTAPVATAQDLEEQIGTAAEFFESRRLAWSFWVCQGWIEEKLRSKVGMVFDRHGLHLVIELPGMAAEKIAQPVRPPAPLLIRRVSDVQTRSDFAHIMTVAFGIPVPISRAVYASERTWGNGFTGYVGYADRLPVSSAATMVTGITAGLYAVGTAHGYQRRGFAETLMRHGLDEIRDSLGIEGSLLQSSEAGLSLYKRMGYRTETRYAVFASR